MSALTGRSAVSLAAAISRREITAGAVMEAHLELLERAHPRLNAVVAERFAEARSEARAIDQRIAGSSLRGEPLELRPLLGVPFTVKESIALEGMPNSAGVLARRELRAPQSATVVKRLVEAGAIPVGVTNTSELTLWIESENPLYGRTNNPYDQTRTAGGSSGGEGAAVGSGGSPFGVAADIGGSIRVPALFCGVFGHKPSAGLLPNTGLWPTTAGEAENLLAVGPLTRRAEDLLPLLRVMAGPDGWDTRTVEMELGDPGEVSLDGLRVTVVEDSSLLPMSRDLRDARERAVGALASAGARINRVSMPSWRNALLPFLAALQNTGTNATRIGALLKEAGEQRTRLPALLFGRGQHTLPTRLTVLAESLPASGATRDKLLATGEELAAELIEAIGDGVLLHPAHLSVAPPHRRTYGRPWLTTPASVFNLAGVPVTEVPLGLSPKGLPVGVQVAAAHGADHLSIAIAHELEAVFGGWVAPEL
ncbi:MAG TPA: amidase [Solirubrobacteraceae bacterium]|nr:amidase [Solirubrobacteraceae bacterium]